MRTALTCIGVSIASIVATVVGLLIYAVAHDAIRSSRPEVSFSDFVADVRAGHVVDIQVRGQRYTFERSDEGKEKTFEAAGPKATKAELEELLKPSDSSKPPPKLSVER